MTKLLASMSFLIPFPSIFVSLHPLSLFT
jgi:hypothetical protein